MKTENISPPTAITAGKTERCHALVAGQNRRCTVQAVTFCYVVAVAIMLFARIGVAADVTAKPYIDITIRGKLTPETGAALAELIEPNQVTKAVDVLSKNAVPVDQVCSKVKVKCFEFQTTVNVAKALVEAVDPWKITIPTMEVQQTTTSLGIVPGQSIDFTTSDRYAVISQNHPIAIAAGLKHQNGPVAILESKLGFSKNDQKKVNSGAVFEVVTLATDKVAIIERDLEIGGFSRRHFRINPQINPKRKAELIKIVRLSDPNITVREPKLPEEGFKFIQPTDGFEFETSSAKCSASPPDWPFNSRDVVNVLSFNEKVRSRLRLGPVRRARILIMDTGIGKALVRSKKFRPVMFVDPTSALMAPAVQVQFSGDPVCRDANRSKYWADIFGAGPAAKGLAHKDICGQADFDFFDLIKPFRRKATATKQTYNPEHGSYVAGLAAGGPAFLGVFPQVASYIGLTVFRVTSKGVSPNLSVKNEIPDITSGFTYASTIQPDIINLSLKTNSTEPFDELDPKSNILLVTSAGNGNEKLDDLSPNNRPASMDNLGNQLITVAALKSDSKVEWWPKSAKSPTRVHIAAPGAVISSFNNDGIKICSSGTSAAAPLVSFTAAIVRALTAAPRQLVRARVLSAADHLPDLEGMVEDSRALNIVAAIDLFVDRVKLENVSEVMRGWIAPNSTERLFKVCQHNGQALNALEGWIDLSLLWDWWRQPNGTIGLRHHARDKDISFDRERGICKAPVGSFSFYDLAQGKAVDVQWADVEKLLPTPFRAIKETILKLDSDGNLRDGN